MVSRIAAWVGGLLIAVLYVHATTTGVGNLLGMLGMAGALGMGLSVSGWVWLVFGIAMPPLVFAGALLLGRGRRGGARILLLAAGITLVAVVQLDVMHLIPESTYFA
ncbi:hypothetical protein [Leucobacter sp. PH1c]|uniref:hypothetical protein n=1 Tax=Leucobacter sp. PH1c TaxID=1397278 RepID=UPI0004684121|nr:hypothetical protein [Leucobacter sp. PH1c]